MGSAENSPGGTDQSRFPGRTLLTTTTRNPAAPASPRKDDLSSKLPVVVSNRSRFRVALFQHGCINVGTNQPGTPMSLEYELQKYPKEIKLKDGSKTRLRPLRKDDEKAFFEFFQQVPEPERMFIKHRVNDLSIIRDWCQNIDFHRNLPLLALIDGKIAGDATLHQHHGGWKRHVGRVSVLVLPQYRGRGLARALVNEIVNVARNLGLDKVEAEFIGEQEAAIRMFAMLGFSNLVRLEDYVKDMQAITHDYVLMGVQLKTDEEYAGME